MAGSSYRECKDRRKGLLKSGAGSPAQPLVSIAMGGAQPLVAAESGQAPVLRGSCSSSSSSSGEESILAPQEICSTHSREGGEETGVTEIPLPLSYPCYRGGSTHAPSHAEGSVVDTGMVLQDEFPLGCSAFQNSPNQVDNT